VWQPKASNTRYLLAQPHLFMLFGVQDFLGGDTVNDVWVFTQVRNTNEDEARHKGKFRPPAAAGGGYETGWYMEQTGTAWSDNTKPEEPVQIVGPCITGRHDTRPGQADSICVNPPTEVPQAINSVTG